MMDGAGKIYSRCFFSFFFFLFSCSCSAVIFLSFPSFLRCMHAWGMLACLLACLLTACGDGPHSTVGVLLHAYVLDIYIACIRHVVIFIHWGGSVVRFGSR